MKIQEPLQEPTLELPIPFYSNSVFVTKQRFDVQFDFMLTQTFVKDTKLKANQKIATEARVVKVLPVTMTLEHAAVFHSVLSNVLKQVVEDYKQKSEADLNV